MGYASRMRLPIRPLRGRWPAWFERRAARFVWNDPRVILDEHTTPDAFTTAMNAFQVGPTIKITAKNRHPAADMLLIDNLDLTNATIVDIGASDGSTSLDLIRKLPAFKSYIIADLYLNITVVSFFRHEVFYDQNDECVLVCGPRCVAWPSRSRLVRLLYSPLSKLAARRPRDRRTVLLLNPEVRALMATDDRVTYAVHDVFEPWLKPAPDVIKVANLLGPYFSDEMIARALQALFEGLEEGGHLLMVDNGRLTGLEPRAGLYKRSGGRFAVVARTVTVPEIDQLILQVRSNQPAASLPESTAP